MQSPRERVSKTTFDRSYEAAFGQRCEPGQSPVGPDFRSTSARGIATLIAWGGSKPQIPSGSKRWGWSRWMCCMGEPGYETTTVKLLNLYPSPSACCKTDAVSSF